MSDTTRGAQGSRVGISRFECGLTREIARHELRGSTEDASRTIIMSEAIEAVIEASDKHAACSAFADAYGGLLPDHVDGDCVFPCEGCGAAIIDRDDHGTDEDGNPYCLACCKEAGSVAEQERRLADDLGPDVTRLGSPHAWVDPERSRAIREDLDFKRATDPNESDGGSHGDQTH